MAAKLIEAYIAAFPMWEILLVTAGIVAISALCLYYKARKSIDVALSLQFLWFLVPAFLLIAYLDPTSVMPKKVVQIAGHMGSGIVLGSFLAFCLYAVLCLYVVGMGVKKFRQVV